MIDKLRQERLEKIVRMDVLGTPHVQIGEVLGLTEAQVSQICAEEDYLLLLEKCRLELATQNEAFNDGWDGVEAQAIDVIRANLTSDSDPEFALRAAMIANRARRRGGNGTGVIAGQTAMRTALRLPEGFVQTIQQNNFVLRVEQSKDGGEQLENNNGPKRLPRRIVNSILPGQLDKILATATRRETTMLEGIDLSGAA